MRYKIDKLMTLSSKVPTEIKEKLPKSNISKIENLYFTGVAVDSVENMKKIIFNNNDDYY